MAGKKIHDSETKIHLIQCAKKEFMEKGFVGGVSPRNLPEGGCDHRGTVFFLSGQGRSVL